MLSVIYVIIFSQCFKTGFFLIIVFQNIPSDNSTVEYICFSVGALERMLSQKCFLPPSPLNSKNNGVFKLCFFYWGGGGLTNQPHVKDAKCPFQILNVIFNTLLQLNQPPPYTSPK